MQSENHKKWGGFTNRRRIGAEPTPDRRQINAAAAEKILAVLKEKYGENYAENLFKIELTGTADVNTAEIQGRLGALYFVKLRDKTEKASEKR